MKKIIIFDLDDTLINSNMKVPRQTYHMLNNFTKNKYLMSVITYNKFPLVITFNTSIYKYMDFVVSKQIDRHKLLQNVLNKIIDKYEIKNLEDYKIYYIDDRIDNIQNIKKYCKNITCFHCKNMYELYLIKKIINSYK